MSHPIETVLFKCNGERFRMYVNACTVTEVARLVNAPRWFGMGMTPIPLAPSDPIFRAAQAFVDRARGRKRTAQSPARRLIHA